MTHAEKLRTIINKQVEGGYPYWQDVVHKDDLEAQALNILLDTAGLRAAYIGKPSIQESVAFGYIRFNAISNKIMKAWHSEDGNNWRAAIDKAYYLLDKE